MKRIILLFVLIIAIAITVPADESIVSLVQSTTVSRASNLTYADILALTREAIDLAGGLNDIIKRGDVVVLKPNLVTSIWNWGVSGGHIPEFVNGVCTDRRVVQAVAEIVREIIGPYNPATGRGKIMVIEGAAKGSTTVHYNNLGYTRENLVHVDEIIALEDEGSWVRAGDASGSMAFVNQVRLNNFVYNRAAGAGQFLRYYQNDGVYWVNKKIHEADALISIPVVKNHWNAVVTGGIKNIGIGAAPPSIYGNAAHDIGRNNMVNHSSPVLHDWIADYFACIPADFVVMDGLQGLQNGPLPSVSSSNALAAHQKNMRSILASKDALAMDIVLSNILGWDYTTVPYLTMLTERGSVGPKPNKRIIPLRGNPRDIVVLGNRKVDDVRGNYRGSMQTGNVGRRIPSQNTAKPTVRITSAVFNGENLNINLNLSAGENNKVDKIDIYINGAYQRSFNTNMNNVTINASNLASGAHNIEVRAYTNYMYCTTATTTARK
ncbi:MAG: DUF362 domain-containing protein [Treponema sp.]|jgi:uncharacterized protein (DUF362 family)|nr:DUF362 domain-containing protein [Treponema sp.]